MYEGGDGFDPRSGEPMAGERGLLYRYAAFPAYYLDPLTKVGSGRCSCAGCHRRAVFVTWEGRWWGLCDHHADRFIRGR
jgi:hypothetical protein